MVKRFFHDALGEALETGKAAVKQAQQASGKMVKTAMEQVAGASYSDDAPPGLEDLKAKKKTPKQLQQLKQKDNFNSKQQIDSTRIGLNKMIISRYKEMQARIKQKEDQREQEEEQKKRQEMEVEQRKKQEQEKNKGTVQMPKGKQSKGILGMFRRRKRGSAESKLGKPG